MLLPVVHSAYGSSETCNKSSIFPTYSRQIPTENKHKTSEITEPLTGIKRLPVDSHTNTHTRMRKQGVIPHLSTTPFLFLIFIYIRMLSPLTDTVFSFFIHRPSLFSQTIIHMLMLDVMHIHQASLMLYLLTVIRLKFLFKVQKLERESIRVSFYNILH